MIELGYIGGLVAAGGNEPQVVAAVLLFRVLTYGIQIPIGVFHVPDLARRLPLESRAPRIRSGARDGDMRTTLAGSARCEPYEATLAG